jgi:NAD(P)-dependent dehydrogenase (short-subunit alcohol dehydrogenase family)
MREELVLFFRCGLDGRTVLITAADSAVGVELTRELSRRGARIIMAVKVKKLKL